MYVVLLMNLASNSVARAFQCLDEGAVVSTTGWLSNHYGLDMSYAEARKAIFGGLLLLLKSGGVGMQAVKLEEAHSVNDPIEDDDGKTVAYIAIITDRNSILDCAIKCEDQEQAIEMCGNLAESKGDTLSDREKEMLLLGSQVQLESDREVRVIALTDYSDELLKELRLRGKSETLGKIRDILSYCESDEKAFEFLQGKQMQKLLCKAGLDKVSSEVVVHVCLHHKSKAESKEATC